MTAIDFVLIAIAVIIVIAGLVMVMRGLKRRGAADTKVVNYDKNGIPIIPRHERDIVDQPDFDDALAGETTIAPDRDYLNAVVEEEPEARHTDPDGQPIQDNGHQNIREDANNTHWQDEHADDVKFATRDAQMQDEGSTEPDAFSSLVSATDSLMPVIDTADEPDFEDNSPILDQHLMEPADQAQNGPLLNAKDNINITILPHQYRDRPPNLIRGRDLLSLIDKYGLRFGAMNMFHRYENKDGTGILWFSMMGITDNGIAPFDPHSVATNTYQGVVVFLSLPHPKALHSFDSMMSIAYMMANDLDAMILDENNDPITTEYKQQLRNQVRDYDG